MSERTILPLPGVSVLAVDPGSCTGWALYDQTNPDRPRLFYDQWFGISGPDSNLSRFKTVHMAKLPRERMYAYEREIARKLCDLVWMVGPRCVVVFEDFILGQSDEGRGGHGGRAGLSPVRVTTAFEMLWEERGLGDGTAWKVWNCGLLGLDPRGLHVDTHAAVTWWSGDTAERMRLNRFKQGSYGGHGATFAPLQTASIKASIPCKDESLKAAGMWVPGRQHARDAMRHMRYYARGNGLQISLKPEWFRQCYRNPIQNTSSY
jgi:hypothetical protein